MKPNTEKDPDRGEHPSGGASRNHPVIWGACRILTSLSRQQPDLSFEVDFPGYRQNFGAQKPDFVVRFRNMSSVSHFIFSGGIGLGVEYMKGAVDVEGDLQSLLHVASASALSRKGNAPLATFEELRNRFGRTALWKGGPPEAGRKSRFRNEFYRSWLDANMTHSCALYENTSDDLDTAQLNKYRNICRQLRLRRGDSLLDAGCGWGGMMFYAAERFGARCTGYTQSEHQYEHVREEIHKRGLEGRVDVVLDDYRTATGRFDRFVCIGMFENKGLRHDRSFFRKTRKLLKPEGIGVLHTIGSGGGRRFNRLVSSHIFPGGSVPTLEKITGRMARENLWVYDLEDLHHHCALTLDEWARRFDQAASSLELPEYVVRMWRLYLNACAVGFKTGDLRNYQITFTPERTSRIRVTRRYAYADPMPA